MKDNMRDRIFCLFLIFILAASVQDVSSDDLVAEPQSGVTASHVSSDDLVAEPQSGVTASHVSSDDLVAEPQSGVTASHVSSDDLVAEPLYPSEPGILPNVPITPLPIPAAGEPRVISYTAAGYSPSPYDPLIITKDIIRKESGKGVGNIQRIEVEIIKKNRKRDEIKDIYIYEIVDDSLQILSPKDDPRAALINFKKLNSLEDIGELKDILFRPVSYYSQEYESRNVVLPEGMEPDVAVVNPRTSYSGIKLNWDNISINGSNDSLNLLNMLKEDFNIKWADRENSVISPIKYIYKNNIKNEIIYINKKNGEADEKIWMQIIGSIKGTETVELNISGQTNYNLTLENKTENGQRRLLIYDWNPNLQLHVRDFSSRDRLFYWYYVKPKKSGSFNAETIVRINDESLSGYPDIIYPQKIDVSEADLRFEVKPIIASSKVYANEGYSGLFGEKLKVEYLIKFIGDASSQYRSRVKVKIYNSTDKYHYVVNEDDSLDFNNIYNSSNISIVYDTPGVYKIPSIWIEDQLYDFDDTITVDTPLQRNKEGITFFIAIFGFLLGLIFNKELNNALKKRVDFFKRKKKADGEKEEKTAEDKDAAVRKEAANKIADLILQALEKGGKEKR
jgi:hypothetical protein